MRARLVLVLGLAVSLAVASSFAAGPGLTAGQRPSRPAAPDFSVSRYTDGRNLSLSDLRGKVVLLYFFFPS